MGKFLISLLTAIGALAAWLWGIDKFPDDPGLDPQRAKLLAGIISEKWQAVLVITAASLVCGLVVSHWLYSWWFEKRLRVERRQIVGYDWQETEAGEVIGFVGSRSAWAYRRYAKINYWERVHQDAYDEVRRAARSGDVRISGEHPNSNARLKPIPDGYWRRADISPLSSIYGTYSSLDRRAQHVAGETNMHHLRVSTDDFEREWPRASLWLRCWAVLWVAVKRVYYRLTPDMWPFRGYWKDRIIDNTSPTGEPVLIRKTDED